MAQATNQNVAEFVSVIRTNLQYQAESLRRFDREETDEIAKRLEDLRRELREFSFQEVS